MKYNFFIMILFLFLISGCVTRNKEIETTVGPLVFDKQEKELKIDFEALEKEEMEPPDFIFLKKNESGYFEECPENEEPGFVAVTSDDFIKIENLVDMKNAYKKISREEYEIITLQQMKIELLESIAVAERNARISEEKLKINYERSLEKEMKRRNFDNISYKILLLFSLIGNIVSSF